MKQNIKLVTVENDVLDLPLHYNHVVQAMIYNSLDADTGRFLHETGFNLEKRTFKMFTFSRLMGDYTIEKESQRITFGGPVSLTVSSPYEAFCNSIAHGLLLSDRIRLGKNLVKVDEIELENDKVTADEIGISTFSSIVVYSTFLRPDGRKYTCYFEPGEKDHEEILESNLRKKYIAFYGKKPPEGRIMMGPLGRTRLSIIKYKGTVVKGYSGRFMLSGPIPLLQMALDTGLGSKNSQGFGCIKILS